MLFKIKNALRNWSDRSNLGSLVFQFARNCVAGFMLILPDKAYAKWFYKLYTKKKLNLNDPKYFDEKIWWLKLNNRDPLLTVCSDKYAVREYVKEYSFGPNTVPKAELRLATLGNDAGIIGAAFLGK